MENNSNYEMGIREARGLLTLMARSNDDRTEVRIAKEVFRWSLTAAAAAVVAVVAQ